MKRFLPLLLLVACDAHELKSVRVAAPQSRYPISMSEFIVVDETSTARENLEIVGQFKFALKCVKQTTMADVSATINDQISAAGGQGLIGLTASVAVTDDCQDVTLQGEIVKARGAR